MAKVGTAYVSIVGDFSRLRRQLKTLGRDIDLDLDLDTTEFDKKVKKTDEKIKRIREKAKKPIVQTMGGDFDVGGFQEWADQQEQARRKAKVPIEADLGAEVDETEFVHYRKVLADTRRAVARRERFKAHLGADFDDRAFADFNRQLRDVNRSASSASDGMGNLGRNLRKTGGEFLSFKSRIPVLQIGLLGTAAYNAAGGVISLASALAPLSGLLGAIGPLASTAAQAKLTLGLATADLEQAVGGLNEKLDEESAAFKKLSPEGKKFARTLQGMKPAFRSLQNAAQQGLFPGLEKALKSAVSNLPKLRQVVRGTAEAFGDLAEQAGRRLGSEEWGRDLQTQGARNEVTLRRLGDSGLDLAEAFKDITLAAGPMVDRLTRWVGALTEGWKQSANAARESGRLERFFKDAGDTFFKTVRILRDLTVAFVNIGRAARKAFGNELLGGIERGAAGLRRWTESARGQRELVAIFTDIGERLKRVGGFIKDLFGDFRQMRAEGKSAGDALGQVFLTAVAKVIENAGELGVKFAKAFVRGFIDADVGGKLILAAFTLSKFGLLGRTVGAIFGAGVTKGAAAGVVGGAGAGAAGGGLLATLRTTLLANAKRIGLVGVGALLAKDVLDEFGRKAREGGPDAFKALADAKGHEGGFVGSFMSLTQSVTGKVPGLKNWDNRVFNDTELSAKKLLPLLEKLKATSAQIDSESARKLREEIGKLSGVSETAKDGLRQVVDQAAEIADTSARLSIKFDANTPISQIRRISAAFDDLRSHTTASLATTARIAERNMRLIARSLGTHSKEGRQALRENFRLAANDIRDLVDSGLATAKQGSAAIRDLFIKYLGTFGIKGTAAKFYLEQGPRGAGFIAGSDQPPISGHRNQRGGPIDIGKPTGDSVPALLEKGEYVLNRKAVRRVGRDTLDRVNFGDAPRFQSGGPVKKKIDPFSVRGPVSSVGAGVQKGLDRLRATANERLAKAIERAADTIDPGNLPEGVGSFDGKAVAKWIIPYLVYGRQHGWTGSVTSGFRSFAEQTAIYNSGVRPAAVPGTSNHEGSQYPRGAVDVTLAEQLASILAGKPGPHLLEFAGAKDPVHFSHPHGGSYQAGGLVAAMLGLQRGGFVRTPINIAADAARKAGFKGGLLRTMLAIAGRESGWNPRAANYVPPDHSIGLWQINQLAHHGRFGSDAQLMDPYVNARAARQLYKAAGLSPWKGGSYESWIDEARGAVQATKGGGGPARDKKPDGDKARRAKRLDAFKKKIGKLDLPSKLQREVARQIEQHNQFSEFASRASGLAGLDEKTGVATLAKVGGLNEGGWLVKDLGVLTKLRNNLLKVRTIILRRKARIEAALKLAQERLKKLSRKGTTPRRWKGLNPARDPIAKWNKQPAEKRKKRVREWHKMGGHLPGDREFTKDDKLLDWPGGRRKTLQSMISVLKNQRSILLDPQGQHGGLGASGTSGTVLGSLFDVQGYATGDNTFKRYSVLPSGGMFGGYIGTAQDALAALGESLKPQADSSAGSDLFDSGRADRLAELLGLERQRALVRDTEVAELLRSARQPPFAGVFHQGGVVPGPVGAERLALVQGGEVVIPANGGADGRPVLNVTFADGMGWLRKFVKVEVDQTLRSTARSSGRVPGIPT